MFVKENIVKDKEYKSEIKRFILFRSLLSDSILINADEKQNYLSLST